MAKKKADAREHVWLQCSETGDLNYRTSVRTKGGMPERLKDGLRKYSPRLRRHTLHTIKRK
ncbi:MAG: 50S ribosomal protein L33 [Planctomycetota bacterium]|nr:MAG: 50S ribosomal protein L33 [Planctomycetota bacterium]